jgi:hypothetical protein
VVEDAHRNANWYGARQHGFPTTHRQSLSMIYPPPLGTGWTIGVKFDQRPGVSTTVVVLFEGW